MSQSTAPTPPHRSRSAGTLTALISAAIFLLAALVVTLITGGELDARILMGYAGVGLFVGGLTTAVSERRRGAGGEPGAHRPRHDTRAGLERRRRGQSLSVWIGPVLFLALAAVSLWLLLDPSTAHRGEAIVFLVIFVIAAVVAPLWALAGRRATDQRLAALDGRTGEGRSA